MRNSLHLAAGASLALALAACSQTTTEDAAAPDATETSTMAAGTDAMATPAAATPTDPQGFVDKASASDMYEIEAGKLAQAQGKSQEVKDFGAMMVKDHSKSTADLKTAAASADGVTVAPKLSAKQQSDLDALKVAGNGFDALYKQQQMAAHEEALTLLRAQADSGAAASLKAFAAKTAPVVEMHLEHVRRLP